jgi:hypothetical protein
LQEQRPSATAVVPANGVRANICSAAICAPCSANTRSDFTAARRPSAGRADGIPIAEEIPVAPGSTLPRPKGGTPVPRRRPSQPPPITRPSTPVDSSTLLRRTPAGDSEVALPAKGLSLTQRRILTLLDTPVRLGELAVGPSFDEVRLQREASRLAEAGLVAYDAPAVCAPAANDASDAYARLRAPLSGRLPVLLLALAGLALAWGGWRLAAVPPARADAKAHSRSAAMTSANIVAPVASPDPPVIATRVLRSEPSERNRDSAKDSRASASSRPSPPASSDAAHDAGGAPVNRTAGRDSQAPATRDGH